MSRKMVRNAVLQDMLLAKMSTGNITERHLEWFLGLTFEERNVLSRMVRYEKFYLTWKEASIAAQSLKIKSSIEYAERYKEDPRLPSKPQTQYQDFPGYVTFLSRE
jgi:hypothetical protein